MHNIGVDLLKLKSAKFGAALQRNQSASRFYCQSLIEQAEVKAEFHPKMELPLNPLLAPLHATFGMSFFFGGGGVGGFRRSGTSCPTSSFHRGAAKANSLIAFWQPLPVGDRLGHVTGPRRSPTGRGRRRRYDILPKRSLGGRRKWDRKTHSY